VGLNRLLTRGGGARQLRGGDRVGVLVDLDHRKVGFLRLRNGSSGRNGAAADRMLTRSLSEVPSRPRARTQAQARARACTRARPPVAADRVRGQTEEWIPLHFVVGVQHPNTTWTLTEPAEVALRPSDAPPP
jgi:hypothetical protein